MAKQEIKTSSNKMRVTSETNRLKSTSFGVFSQFKKKKKEATGSSMSCRSEHIWIEPIKGTRKTSNFCWAIILLLGSLGFLLADLFTLSITEPDLVSILVPILNRCRLNQYQPNTIDTVPYQQNRYGIRLNFTCLLYQYFFVWYRFSLDPIPMFLTQSSSLLN